MRILKLALVSLPLVLAGCFDFDDNSHPIYHPTPTPAPAPVAAPNPPAAPADCGCPGPSNAPQPCPNSAACPNPPAAQNWHPSEGHLVRAGELVMEQQRQNGGVRPSHAAMVTYLQTHMQPAVTAQQAEVILEEMGL